MNHYDLDSDRLLNLTLTHLVEIIGEAANYITAARALAGVSKSNVFLSTFFVHY